MKRPLLWPFNFFLPDYIKWTLQKQGANPIEWEVTLEKASMMTGTSAQGGAEFWVDDGEWSPVPLTW